MSAPTVGSGTGTRWEVRRDARDPNAWDVYDVGTERKIAHLPWCSKAEAALIAAAPEMLKALREAARDFRIMRVGSRMEAWEAVVAKAEGGMP